MRECSPPTTCHMSCVTCHVSHVTCHMSHIMCHMSYFFFIFFFGQSGEAYQWRVCYQRGLPRLVFHTCGLYFPGGIVPFLVSLNCQFEMLPLYKSYIDWVLILSPWLSHNLNPQEIFEQIANSWPPGSQWLIVAR